MNVRPRFSKVVSCLIIALLTCTALAVAQPSSEPTITLSITEPQYSFGTVQLDGGQYATLQASQGQEYTTIVGAPKLPVFNYLVEIPVGATPVLTVSGASWVETTLAAEGVPGQIVPVQPSRVKLPDVIVDFTQDAAAYQANAFSPSIVASIKTVGWLRGHCVALIEVSPVQYNPVTGELRLLTGCTVSVALPGSDMIQTQAAFARYDTPTFISQEQALFENYGTLETGVSPKQAGGYLIIVHDAFADEMQSFADWKGSLGFDVTMTLTSEIPGGITKENIHNYIQDAYDTWTVPPAFVLLVGDTAQIPTYTGSDTGSCTDLYYVTVNGTDYFADICIGRFPAATETQVINMVDKTLFYEQGLFEDNSWIKHAVFMASSDNWGVSEGTHNFVISTYMEPNEWVFDKLYCHTYGATTAQVTAAINDGRGIAIYSGHGGTDCWADGPYFSQGDVSALVNDEEYPFVCSHACLTNQFTVSECFGETWLRGSHQGGLAFWGATTYSYWDEDDILERSMFQAWFTDGIGFIGGMTNQALLYLYEEYGGGGMSQYYFEEYNVLGDPSVNVWMGDPNPNLPPGVPAAPTGPTQGVTFLTYEFTATATSDPEGTMVYLRFDFDDGNTSDYYGPFTNGQTATTSHVWMQAGTYAVRAMAMDENGTQSKWSDPHTITIAEKPKLNITDVKGGIGFRITIENTVDQSIQAIAWSVEPHAPVILISTGMYGTIGSLSAGDETTVRTGLLVGFGPLTYTIKAGDAQKTGSGFLLGIFVAGLK